MMFENFERRHVAHLLKIVQSLVCTIFCIDSKKKGPKCAGCFGEVFLTLHVLCTAVLDTWHTSGIHILVPQAETMSAICLVFVGEVQHGLFQKCHYNGIFDIIMAFQYFSVEKLFRIAEEEVTRPNQTQ